MGVDGECMKAFDIKDGYALHTLLKENGIIPSSSRQEKARWWNTVAKN